MLPDNSHLIVLASGSPRSSRSAAFTLLEMLTTVGALVILLGLMVSLARHVRRVSADDVTKDLLRRLDGLMAQYEARHNQLPHIAPFLVASNGEPERRGNANLEQLALENNRQFVAALRDEPNAGNGLFAAVSDAARDEAVLRDAWGTPIVFMSSMHPAIGMAPQNRPFFFSAGPDRNFLTQEDNLYSYEEAGPAPHARAATSPTTGHAE